MRKFTPYFIIVALLAVVLAGAIKPAEPLMALEPAYGQIEFQSNYMVPSTADQEITSAPGSSYSWVLTSAWYCIATAEANGTAQIEDAAGTPIVAASIPLDTKGQEGMIYFGDGVIGSTNSAWQVDFSGSTGEVALVLNCYKIYNP